MESQNLFVLYLIANHLYRYLTKTVQLYSWGLRKHVLWNLTKRLRFVKILLYGES